jgi:hypothetical protein
VVRAVIVAAASLCIGTAALQAQAPDWRTVQGRVVRPAPFLQGDSTAVVTVSDQVVVLHRVAPSVAGPLDSVRTDRDGRYRFRYQPSGGPEAIYFVSATYGGIAYFTNPLRSRDVGGAEAEIAVFDTTTRAFPLTVRGRHLIVGALDSTRERTIVEIFEISNDSTRTIVAADGPDAEPTWSFAIPEGAREVKAGQGDLPADAFVQAAGRVSLYAALAPAKSSRRSAARPAYSALTPSRGSNCRACSSTLRASAKRLALKYATPRARRAATLRGLAVRAASRRATGSPRCASTAGAARATSKAASRN